MKWMTREKIKVDRVAGPWLIKTFIDSDPALTGGIFPGQALI